MIEPHVETLFRPLLRGELDVPDGRIVYANTMSTPPELLELLGADVVTWQPRRNLAIDAGLANATPGGVLLADADLPPLEAVSGGAKLALLPLVKERDASLGMAAALWRGLEPGGLLVASAPNAGGARSYEKTFEELGNVGSMSKNKCRVFWVSKGSRDAPAAWGDGVARRAIDGGWTTRGGVFSADHVDPASAMLIDVIDEVVGEVHDLGAGWGYLAGSLVRAGVDVDRLHLWEDDLVALRLAAENVGAATLRWADVTRETPTARADTVVMNPPFHAGHKAEVRLGEMFVLRASTLLKPGGVLWMVANQHLPYEVVLERHFTRYERVAERDGFKVFRAQK